MTYTIAQNQTGPLPLKNPVRRAHQRRRDPAFSGTCWSKSAGAFCGVSVYLDGIKLGDVPLCFNAASQHLTLPTQFFATTLDFGPHTITLQAQTDATQSDKNDFYSLWIVD